MTIPILHSANAIERSYRTGEEPVLVSCSDRNVYICKYMRSSAAAYKLACEVIGNQMAEAWGIDTPRAAFVKIAPAHWQDFGKLPHSSAMTIGSCRRENVMDITPTNYSFVSSNRNVLRQLLHIALFDLWIANEDRNANNANLLYDIGKPGLISIDYGCILNTATYEYPLSPLTGTDSILSSELFCHLRSCATDTDIRTIVSEMKRTYADRLTECQARVPVILDAIPKSWNIPASLIQAKLSELFDLRWTQSVWNCFVEYLKENAL